MLLPYSYAKQVTAKFSVGTIRLKVDYFAYRSTAVTSQLTAAATAYVPSCAALQLLLRANRCRQRHGERTHAALSEEPRDVVRLVLSTPLALGSALPSARVQRPHVRPQNVLLWLLCGCFCLCASVHRGTSSVERARLAGEQNLRTVAFGAEAFDRRPQREAESAAVASWYALHRRNTWHGPRRRWRWLCRDHDGSPAVQLLPYGSPATGVALATERGRLADIPEGCVQLPQSEHNRQPALAPAGFNCPSSPTVQQPAAPTHYQ